MQFANNADGFAYTSAGAEKPSWLGTGVATGAGNKSDAPTWASGWTKGLSNSAVTTENLEGETSGTITLDAGVEYLLTSGFVVKNGGTLNIPAGTVIKATGGTSSYIGVAQGGKINVNGSAESPVVMTSGSATPQRGDWGGLVIAGKAPTNKGRLQQLKLVTSLMVEQLLTIALDQFATYVSNTLVQLLPTKKNSMEFLYLVLVLELLLSMLRPTKQGMMASNSLVEQ